MRLDEILNWAVGDHTGHAKREHVPKGHVIVWVRIKDLIDRVPREFRISPDSTENRIKTRFDDAVAHWENGGWMNAPQIGLGAGDDVVMFDNGRHRVAAAAALGEEWVPVWVDQVEIPKLKELVGLSLTEPSR